MGAHCCRGKEALAMDDSAPRIIRVRIHRPVLGQPSAVPQGLGKLKYFRFQIIDCAICFTTSTTNTDRSPRPLTHPLTRPPLTHPPQLTVTLSITLALARYLLYIPLYQPAHSHS